LVNRGKINDLFLNIVTQSKFRQNLQIVEKSDCSCLFDVIYTMAGVKCMLSDVQKTILSKKHTYYHTAYYRGDTAA